MLHHMLRALAVVLLPALAAAHASSDASDRTGEHSGEWAVLFHESLDMSNEQQAYNLAVELGLEHRGQVRCPVLCKLFRVVEYAGLCAVLSRSIRSYAFTAYYYTQTLRHARVMGMD